LKASEKRADDWQERMGVEQTEIDALATLRPGLLRQLAVEALAPFYDYTLAERVEQAQGDWLDLAEITLAAQLDTDKLAVIREDAEAKLADLEDEVESFNDALRVEVGDNYELPEAVIPEPDIDAEPDGLPLFDSRWSYAEQSLALKRSRSYERGE
jgi:hypothetical protein